jgi:hypothetical protein
MIFGENLGKTHIWEFQNKRTGKWVRCIDRAIRWSDGRTARFEMAIDIHDRKVLRKRCGQAKRNIVPYSKISTRSSTLPKPAGDSLIFRSYEDGSRGMTTLKISSIPPLPPLLTVDVRSGVVYPISSTSSALTIFPIRIIIS